jgi:hypothetical protein
MPHYTILKFMDNIILNVAINLIKCHNNFSPLIFPKYFNNAKELLRVSEQESKILFSNEFIKNNIKFAVEVPTESKHMQTGKTPKSARFDLVTYKKDYDFDWVIELKSKNPPLKHFTKDFEKMVLTDTNCIWFHTLKNSDRGTFDVLLKKINVGIISKINNFVGKHTWKIIFIVLEKRKLYTLDLVLENKKYDPIKSIDQFMKKEL